MVAVAQPEIRAILASFFHGGGQPTATSSPSESPVPSPSVTNITPEPTPHSQPTPTPAETVNRERYELELNDGFEGDQEIQQDVMELQTLLNKHGYSLEVDGLFGVATDEAVRQFQCEHGLQEDGIVGSDTWAALLAN